MPLSGRRAAFFCLWMGLTLSHVRTVAGQKSPGRVSYDSEFPYGHNLFMVYGVPSTHAMPQDPNRPVVPIPDDLPDSPSDAARLKEEVTYIDLPDITDIPGQENIVPPPLGALSDTTISSADEEGIVNDNSEDDDYFAEGEQADDAADTAGIP